LLCNWYRNREWIESIVWEGQERLNGKNLQVWFFKRQLVGSIKSQGLLIFLAVDNAGHLVPMDQPEIALHMIRSCEEGILKQDMAPYE